MYSKILVPVDGSDTALKGLNEAIKIATALGSRIRLLHIVNEFIFGGGDGAGIYSGDLIASLRSGGQSLLAQAAARARGQGVETDLVMIESMGGCAADFIVAMCRAAATIHCRKALVDQSAPCRGDV